MAALLTVSAAGCGSPPAAVGQARTAVQAGRAADPASVSTAFAAYGRAVHADAGSSTLQGLRAPLAGLLEGTWSAVEATAVFGTGANGCSGAGEDFTPSQPAGASPVGATGSAGFLAESLREIGGDSGVSQQLATSMSTHVGAGGTNAAATFGFVVTALGLGQSAGDSAILYDEAHGYLDTHTTGAARTAAIMAFDAGTEHADACLGH